MQIVVSVRDGNRVRQKIMRHVGVAQNDAELAQSPSAISSRWSSKTGDCGEKNGNRAKWGTDRWFKTTPWDAATITGIHEVYGEIYKQIGFDHLWG